MTQHEGLGGEAFDKLPDGLKRQLMGMAANAMMSRAQIIDQLLFQGARDIDSDCGYPKSPIGAQFYQDLYDRGEIPARVVEVFPHECWQVSPSVYEDEDPDQWTPFEEAWYDLGQSLRAEQSWHSGEAGSLVWELLHRADIVSGIGQYAVILLGLDDNTGLDQPAAMIEPPRPGLTKPATKLATLADAQRRLLYARVFPETLATITRLEEDQKSPRFGQPAEYEITFADPSGQGVSVPLGASGQASAPGQVTRLVHWSRVIHVADNRQSNEVYGVPRQQQVLNRLLDLRKIYGGSAEMYWKGAFMGVSLETWPQLGWDVDINEEKTKDMMWRWQNGLQRWIQLVGQTAKPLSPQVVDPSGQINVHLEAICIKLGCPIRIFKGSERGELASSQDDAAWNDRLKLRQHRYLTPRLIVPFVDRLVSLGVLPEPEEYLVWWPDLTSKSDSEKATIASARTTAIVAYASSPEARATMAPLDYWTRIQGYTDEEAQAIVENAAEEKAKQEAEAAKQQAEADAKAQAEHEKALELAQASNPAPQPGAPNQGTNPNGTAPNQTTNPDAVTSPRGGKGGPTGNVDWNYEENAPLTNAKKAALTGGRWVTIEGSPVYIKGGKIVAGPKELVGEATKDAGKSHDTPTAKKAPAADTPSKSKAEPASGANPAGFHPPDVPRQRSSSELGKSMKEVAHTAEHLKSKDRAALKKYTGKSYSEINGELREGVEDGKHAATIKTLREAFSKAPELKDPVTVFRGVTLPPAAFAKLNADMKAAWADKRPVEMQGFQSTSMDFSIASGFSRGHAGNVVFEIKAKKGISADAVSKFSESEFLLDHGSKFRVLGARTVTVSKGKTQRVIQMEQVL
jgi:uncharacterized protein